MAIKMASKIGPFFHCFVCCCCGSRWGDTEQVVVKWQHPVASKKALDILQQAMHIVLHPCLHMASKWLTTEVHLFVIGASYV